MAAIALVQELDQKKQFNEFTKNRREFEEFILRYRYFVNQINKNYSRAGVALRPVVKMYEVALRGVRDSMSDSEIINKIKSGKIAKYSEGSN